MCTGDTNWCNINKSNAVHVWLWPNYFASSLKSIKKLRDLSNFVTQKNTIVYIYIHTSYIYIYIYIYFIFVTKLFETEWNKGTKRKIVPAASNPGRVHSASPRPPFTFFHTFLLSSPPRPWILRHVIFDRCPPRFIDVLSLSLSLSLSLRLILNQPVYPWYITPRI